MEEIQELKERLKTERPAAWDDLPDLSLYMDQVIGYMSRQLIRYGEEERLTPAMVNNYIKDGHLPRAEGKRYTRTHLAYLTAICAMKQVLPVRDAGLLVNHAAGDPQAMYALFRKELDAALTATAEGLDAKAQAEDLNELALSLALRSYADKLACQRVLELLREKTPQSEGKPKKNRKEDKQ